ncbi:hypothetical protein CIW52_07095 [Mycolicibacterium sp. P9-64]|uniref:hypothetical protein n=1 Tax=Mycolicibacterium sp. P9-64 TaxID=2024612 RepID=UPI0011F048B3|nr:hypothetical protein [Mycolicibacterium sp. P9-64]KAA0085643.1 hypothetical protein CIW52_07095 [Mycolicibacterium sp. P9-64]
MRAVVTVLAVLMVVTGCARAIGGSPRATEYDQAYFFAGDVPTYGQTVSPDDVTRLGYLRALRRIDPCGLLTRESMAKVGEIGSVGTLFAFDECDVDVKVAGENTRWFLSIQLEFARVEAVHETSPGSCEYLMPLPLSRLPGARPLSGPEQPAVRIGLISQHNCVLVEKVVHALEPRLASLHLPIRDAVGAYPAPLAERDPCQLQTALKIATWDVRASRPYACALELGDGTGVRVVLQPELFDPETDTRARRNRDGVDVFVDTAGCAATAFVGPQMQRKFLGGDYVRSADVVIRPAVTVRSAVPHCDLATDGAVAAAKVFG